MPAIIANTNIFKDQATTAELLRPELENGNISQHDYDTAVRSLPGIFNRTGIDRNTSLTYGFIAGAIPAAYGRLYARPRWSFQRLIWIPMTCAMLAAPFGAFVSGIRRQWSFFVDLDDPKGASTAVRNALIRSAREQQENTTRFFPSSSSPSSQNPESTVSTDWTIPDSNNTSSSPTQPERVMMSTSTTPSEPISKQAEIPKPVITTKGGTWDAIRAANARAQGKESSWDALRQGHERVRVQGELDQATHPVPSPKDEKVIAQEQFDALLEAERRRGQSDQTSRETWS